LCWTYWGINCSIWRITLPWIVRRICIWRLFLYKIKYTSHKFIM